MYISDNEIRTRWIDDGHVHFRQERMMFDVVPYTVKYCKRALVMPNLKPPIRTGSEAMRYKAEIKKAAKRDSFEPLVTIKLLDSTTPHTVREAKRLGVIAGKMYPRGVTKNSEDGVLDPRTLYPTFEAMQECGMVLSVHAEMPGAFCTDAEKLYCDTIRELSRDFPRLRIVVEHVSSRHMIDTVCELPDRVAATITLHHLILTRHDFMGGGKVRPHHFFAPEPKRPEDRERIQWAACFGGPKFFFGSDSAPHPRKEKECEEGSCGAFSAPVVPSRLLAFFQEMKEMQQFEPFTSEYFALFYDLPRNEGEITLVRRPWQVPAMVAGEVVPLCARQMLEWDLAL